MPGRFGSHGEGQKRAKQREEEKYRAQTCGTRGLSPSFAVTFYV